MDFTCDVVPDFYYYTEPLARKSHRCCECRARIVVGEKHFHARGKWDGEVSSHRQHLACMEACILIRDEFMGGDCIPFGALKEAFDEMRWQYDRVRDRDKEPWKRLRTLMAGILRRERKAAKT